MTVDVTATLKELGEIEATDPAPFPAEFISKASGAISRCLTGTNEKPFSLRQGEPNLLRFEKPAYVSRVDVVFSKRVPTAGFVVTALDHLANSRQLKYKTVEDAFAEKVSIELGCVCTAISLTQPVGLFGPLKSKALSIVRITIIGYQIEDFDKLSSKLGQLEGLRDSAIAEINEEKEALDRREAKLDARETAVEKAEAAKTAELTSLEDEIDKTKAQLAQAVDDLKIYRADVQEATSKKLGLEAHNSELDKTGRTIDAEIIKKKNELNSLAGDEADQRRRLAELTSNVNLFSEEFSSFSNHGANQARIFIGLSLVPLLVVAFLTYSLFAGAVDLSVKYVTEPHLDLLTVFVTRLPYLTVCASILAVCYSVLRFLFNRVSAIYAERLDFAKIGIVAKDVATASAESLALSDKDLYEARTYLKIEMLKSYLAGNIGTFTYKKRPPAAAVQSALQDGEQPVDDEDEDEDKTKPDQAAVKKAPAKK